MSNTNKDHSGWWVLAAILAALFLYGSNQTPTDPTGTPPAHHTAH